MAEPTPKTYADIQIHEGDEVIVYSKEGLKVKRTFKINWADNSSPSATLATILQNGASQFDWSDPNYRFMFPSRGCPHPTITPEDFGTINPITYWASYRSDESELSDNPLCADHIVIKALTSTQAIAEVEYCIFDARIQEPVDYDTDAENGNYYPAFVTIGSSVQTTVSAVDIFGNQLTVPYISHSTDEGAGEGIMNPGAYNIFPFDQPVKNVPTNLGVEPDFTYTPGQPAIKPSANIQMPTQLLRFQRRESAPRDPHGFVGYINSEAWTIPALINYGGGVGESNYEPEIIQPQCALCTRIENESMDNGVSYLVTYEFQITELISIPLGTMFVGPDNNQIFDDTNYVSPWQVGFYYTLPSGYGTGPNKNWNPDTQTWAQVVNTTAVQPGQIPPDTCGLMFQIYGTCDFNGLLHLTPIE